MKNFIKTYFLTIFLTMLIYATILPCSSSTLMDIYGHPTDALSSLLNIFDIQHDRTLPSIVKETQKSWLRPAGLERWQLPNTFSQETIDCIAPHLERIGLIHEIMPSQKQYTYALFMGATLKTVIKRLAYLIKQWKEGLRFNHLVILTGQRDLIPKESIDVVLNSPLINVINPEALKELWKSVKTETDMIQAIITHALPITILQDICVTVVDAPKKQLSDGTWRRPTTADTVICWLMNNPTPGPCIAISNQPHILYQQSVLKTILPVSFDVAAMGSHKRISTNIAEILDALARLLYQENIRYTLGH